MLLKAKKRINERQATEDTKFDYSDIKKELHPETVYANKSYSKNSDGFSMKDKFKVELHKSTIAAVKKFDQSNQHKSATKKFNFLDDSSSDDSDYQFSGKKAQKATYMSPIKRDNTFSNLYTKMKESGFKKGKPFTEYDSDEERPKNRNWTKSAPQGSRKITALERKIMEGLSNK